MRIAVVSCLTRLAILLYGGSEWKHLAKGPNLGINLDLSIECILYRCIARFLPATWSYSEPIRWLASLINLLVLGRCTLLPLATIPPWNLVRAVRNRLTLRGAVSRECFLFPPLSPV